MFGNFFKKTKEKEEPSKNEPVIVMVLLDNSIDLSHETILKPYHGNNTDVRNIQMKDNTITFDVDNEMGFISLMPAPVPWSDLEGPCATAWYWKDAGHVLKNHKAHLLISILPQNQQKQIIDRVMSITRIVSAVLQTTDAMGVYWGPGTVVHSRENFIKRSADMENGDLAYELWIDFRIQMFPDKKCNVVTTGMKAFGHTEIEIIKSFKDPLLVLQFVINIVDYLLKNGPVIKDGDTVGEDADQKIKVQYKKSVWDRAGNVMTINY